MDTTELFTRPGVSRNRAILIAVWFFLYASFTLLTPPLLDDADSVHAEVAREMLVRHDWTTLYANGIRYLEKAPLHYWLMAISFKIFGPHTAAARLPLALAVLALALALESFARRAFQTTRAGLYAALILLTSFGIFIFSRINIPDILVCVWLTLALYAYWLSERQPRPSHLLSWVFAAACALNVLTKGLIGIVFPVLIVLLHLACTRRNLRTILQRIRQLHPVSSAIIFFAIAAPWHILIALANPTQGHPGHLAFMHGHWTVPLPTDGNVHGWLWFYFVNEQVLRYLNLRVPRDYDTVPLALFWGLMLIWLMPWSAFIFKALSRVPLRKALRPRVSVRTLTEAESTRLLLGIWAAVPMIFFSFSTRQEYYVLPSLPPLALLIAGWLTDEADEAESFAVPNLLVRSGQRISIVLLVLGAIASLAAGFFALHGQPIGPNIDLASLLKQNPGDYALSFGHFLDLDTRAMGAFERPLILTAIVLFGGALTNWLLRRNYKPHAANLWLTAAAIGFLVAAHMGLQTFAPVLSSYHLAEAIAPQLHPDDLIVIHGEYEAGSTLGFYLQRNDIHILNGRSSNLWYGSFFPDAPHIFEDNSSIALEWAGVRRVFLWQDLSDPLPNLPGETYLIAQSGGKEILSNHPSPY
ncbi:glycosyl transferase [Edaphobacter acidisoli]|uniref:Glycosyl transferase n=1 Tax=Edaphobacter acidisoli TaxID=2040573 RepID=A0A916RVF0_9BACT|nr:glycosyltransferase family 39 protein [Edaphobacter acidisoli]GGA71051.1 glycosyl transferase [Edaphobacter acidisoli]